MACSEATGSARFEARLTCQPTFREGLQLRSTGFMTQCIEVVDRMNRSFEIPRVERRMTLAAAHRGTVRLYGTQRMEEANHADTQNKALCEAQPLGKRDQSHGQLATA
jgi:hypothetical protein